MESEQPPSTRASASDAQAAASELQEAVEMPVEGPSKPRDTSSKPRESGEPAISARVASIPRKRPRSSVDSTSPAFEAPRKQQKRAEAVSSSQSESPELDDQKPESSPILTPEESTDWTLADASMIPQNLREKEEQEVLRLLQQEVIQVPAEAFELEPPVSSSSEFSYWRAVDRFYDLEEDE